MKKQRLRQIKNFIVVKPTGAGDERVCACCRQSVLVDGDREWQDGDYCWDCADSAWREAKSNIIPELIREVELYHLKFDRIKKFVNSLTRSVKIRATKKAKKT